LDTYTNLVVYRGHNYPVWSIDVSPYNYYFATGSHDRTARIWTLERNHPVRVLAGHLSDVECVRFHPNCNYLATSSSDKTIRLWDVHRGKCARVFTSTYNLNTSNNQLLPGHPSRTGTILSLAVSPDGKLLASGGDDGSVVVWELSSGRVVSRFGVESTVTLDNKSEFDLGAVHSLDFSKDSGYLSAGYANGKVGVFNIKVDSSNSLVSTSVGSKHEISGRRTDGNSESEVVALFPTKRTPVFKVQFTNRNLLVCGGPFIPYP
jgi:transcription initiation factor TFIID subunit 5